MRFDNGLSWLIGVVYENGDDLPTGGVESTETWAANSHLTFETDSWLFAAELIYGETELRGGGQTIDTESLSGLLTANFAYSSQASVTGRLSFIGSDLGNALASFEYEQFKSTLAHNYAFTDNLLLVLEVNYSDAEFTQAGNQFELEQLTGAVELLFSF